MSDYNWAIIRNDRVFVRAAPALCVLTVASAIAVGQFLPKATFFTLPSLYYCVSIILFLLSPLKRMTDEWCIAASIVTATFFVLVGEALILSQGVPTRWLAWGRFPLGDAADFISNSIFLTQNGEFVSIRGRPLANAFLAGLWRSVGFDLALLGLAGSTLCAIALFFFARVVLVSLGIVGGLTALAVAGDFLHEHLASASTEPIGFFVGTTASAILIACAQNRSGWLFAAGLGTLALAFLMRAGALFVLPTLLLFPFFLPLSMGRRLQWIGGAVVAVFIAVSFHIYAVKTLTPNSPGFVNAPKSWYAVIAMGDEARGLRPSGTVRDEARWLQIFDDHPGLNKLPIDQQGVKFVEIVWKAASERPLSVLAGTMLEYKDQILRAGLFRFIDNKPVRAMMFALFIVGFIYAAVRSKHEPVAALLVLAGIGLLTSIPFLHGGENRVHIATAGLMAGIAGYGILAIHRVLPVQIPVPSGRIGRWINFSLVIPAIVIALAVLTFIRDPIVVSGDKLAGTSCAEGTKAVNSSFGAGSIVGVSPEAGGLFSVSFQDLDAWESAHFEWLEQARWKNIFLYAPIDPNSVNLFKELELGKNTVGEASVAYIVRFQDQTGINPSTGLIPLVRNQDLSPGMRIRCL